ncbi:MAG: arylamine N-acetyltransferase [Mycobacterium sp.]
MVDLSDYFTRIDYTGSVEPNLETLQALVTAHGEHIPFENLNPLMGIPVADLSAEALAEKMVRHRRGGYCYEQNGLLGYVLAELGFEITPLTGRVVWQNPVWLDGPPPAETHCVLAVRIPGDPQRYLVDVGFGGQTLTSAIRFVPDEVQQTRHEPYRLRVYGNGPADGYVLETLLGEKWHALYTFTDQARPPIDLVVGSWYVSTHPTSTFVAGLSASLITAEARWNLRGRNLAVHHLGGPSERTRFDNATQVLDVLMNRFGIDVGGIGDVHARITEVLDA